MAFRGYAVGTTYNCRHGRYGGRHLHTKGPPVVIAFTGASGRQQGYARFKVAKATRQKRSRGEEVNARILLVASCGLRVGQQGGINRLGR